MLYLAIEKELKPICPQEKTAILREEATLIRTYLQDKLLKDIYFNEQHCAVLIVNDCTRDALTNALTCLPLVKEGYITFDIMELHPYIGLARLEEH